MIETLHQLRFGVMSFLAAVILTLAQSTQGAAQSAAPDAPDASAPAGPIIFNQHQIDAFRGPDLDVSDPLVVFRAVFAQLPERMVIYPSEGYYYFHFYAGGAKYYGNLMFDVRPAGPADAAQGNSLSFYYAPEQPDHTDLTLSEHLSYMGKQEGLVLTRTGDFTRQLCFDGRCITAEIYQAKEERQTPPPLYEGEHFVGPIFDESGLRFSLIYHDQSKVFYYLLNQTGPIGDSFLSFAETTKTGRAGLYLGMRSGFVFLTTEDGRAYLVAVNQDRVARNSIYDGPFDQLPDAFMDGDALIGMIEAADPSKLGKIGRYGDYLANADIRYAITSYSEYGSLDELLIWQSCADQQGVVACLQEITQ